MINHHLVEAGIALFLAVIPAQAGSRLSDELADCAATHQMDKASGLSRVTFFAGTKKVTKESA
ncbi:hypothetical protein FCE95_13955 [Luteimonas gilva]|uniref:Uncharacterized protein n=1 Tax=Luteimonas gilva TaxID=2572684 RepID=A0A4U5JJS4_9GAMM|nr:hypothetical protein [Luteimonas gilva]TKR29265.1 hypothetical protein FCE95_13955 [Luteimonas gilva]